MALTSAQFLALLAQAGIMGSVVLGVVRGPGGSSIFVSPVRIMPMVEDDHLPGLRSSLPFNMDPGSFGDAKLIGDLGVIRAWLMTLGKHDLSPILPFRVIGGEIDGDEIPRLHLQLWPAVGTAIAVSGSMGVISELSSSFTGLDRNLFRSMADVRSSLVMKLMHLWKTHVLTSQGRPEIPFIDFVVKATSVLPLFTGCWEDGSRIDIKLRTPSDQKLEDSTWKVGPHGAVGLQWLLTLMLWGYGLFSVAPRLFVLIEGGVARSVEYIARKIRSGVHQRSTTAESVQALYLSLLNQANGLTPLPPASPVIVDLDHGVPAPNGLRGALRCVFDLCEQHLMLLKDLASKPIRTEEDGVVVPRCPVPPASQISFGVLERCPTFLFRSPVTVHEVEQRICSGYEQKALVHWRLWGLVSTQLAQAIITETQRISNLQSTLPQGQRVVEAHVNTAGEVEMGDGHPFSPAPLTLIRVDPAFGPEQFEKVRIKPDSGVVKLISTSVTAPQDILDDSPAFTVLQRVPRIVDVDELASEAQVVSPSEHLTTLMAALRGLQPGSSSTPPDEV